MSVARFPGEQLGGYSIKDICDFSNNDSYVLVLNGCYRNGQKIEELLTKVPGYDPTLVQTLTNNAGVIQRV